ALVTVRVALEEARGLERGEIDAIEEGPITLGRRAGPGEEDIIALPAHDALPAGQPARQGRARVAVAVEDGAVPDEARPILRGRIEEERPPPALVALEVAQQRLALLVPGQA